jgi:hypothetical protein
MQSIRQYLTEERERVLNVFDIDETLFKTKALVKVIRGGKVVKQLNNVEFNTYKLQDGESFDFGQFKDAKVFQATSTPIGRMVSRLKLILRNMGESGSKVILVTARSDFDNKDAFLSTFKANGIDIDRVYVERAGNLRLGSSAKNKRFVFHKYLRGNKFDKIRLFDDSTQNLNSFMSLEKAYPGVSFEAWHVGHDGKTSKFQ